MRFALVGAGPIGISIAGCALAKGHVMVALVDIDPGKRGRPLSEIVPGAPADVTVEDDVAALPAATDVVFHATSSSLARVADQLLACLEAGHDVVSTCEELAYPWHSQADLSTRLDQAARARGARLLGTGINPGFVMDLLPLVLSAACWGVRSVSVTRVLDATTRRLPFQQKVGVGMTAEAAEDAIACGTFGHVGLAESAWMLSDRLGLGGTRLDEEVRPVMSPDTGLVVGLHQDAVVFSDDGEVVRMRIEMVAGAEDPQDRIELDAIPPLALVVPGGVPGDAGTAAVVVNAASRLSLAGPGLVCMADLPVPYAARLSGQEAA